MLAEAPPVHAAAVLALDPHRPGGIDRALLDRQTWLTAANQASLYRSPDGPKPAAAWPRPWLEEIVAGASSGSVHDAQRVDALRHWTAAIPRRYPEGVRSTRAGFWGDFSTFLCGGTEEEIIRKGSPLAAELCRVLIALAAIAGFHGRLVFLYADQPPYRHTVTELWVGGRWIVFDVVSDRSFAWPKHGFVSAWQLHEMPALLDGLPDHGRLPYVDSRFYRTPAVAPYNPWNAGHRFPWDALDRATAARLIAGEAA